MSTLHDPLHSSGDQVADAHPNPSGQQSSSLRKDVERSLHHFFAQLGDESVTNLYDLVLTEIEAPLLKAVLSHTGSNQSKASIMLGLNRGTLRKKLKQHGML
jgi:Fis family transcriptional regulator